jgi:hypothetical protein
MKDNIDNILKKANEIVNHRTEESERQYGPFSENMADAARIFTAITGQMMSTENMFKALLALKLARDKQTPKQDNLLDAVGYMGGLDNFRIENRRYE